MNSIEFRFKKRSEDWRFDEVRVVIDGRDLVDLLKEHEAPFAAAEGSPSIAGAYSGLLDLIEGGMTGHCLCCQSVPSDTSMPAVASAYCLGYHLTYFF